MKGEISEVFVHCSSPELRAVPDGEYIIKNILLSERIKLIYTCKGFRKVSNTYSAFERVSFCYFYYYVWNSTK